MSYRKFETETEADTFADRMDARGLDPIVEQCGNGWIVYYNTIHHDDRYAND